MSPATLCCDGADCLEPYFFAPLLFLSASHSTVPIVRIINDSFVSAFCMQIYVRYENESEIGSICGCVFHALRRVCPRYVAKLYADGDEMG